MNGSEKDLLIFFNCNPVVILVVILNVRPVCSGDMKALSLTCSGFFLFLEVGYSLCFFPFPSNAMRALLLLGASLTYSSLMFIYSPRTIKAVWEKFILVLVGELRR